MIERFELFSYAFIGVLHSCYKISAIDMGKYGLKGSYAKFFSILSKFKDGITATKLIEVCGIDKAGVSRAIADLEKAGYVTKIVGENKRYRAKIVLTESGEQVAEYIRDRVHLAIEAAGKGISEQERQIFYNTLFTLNKNLSELSNDYTT